MLHLILTFILIIGSMFLELETNRCTFINWIILCSGSIIIPVYTKIEIKTVYNIPRFQSQIYIIIQYEYKWLIIIPVFIR